MNSRISDDVAVEHVRAALTHVLGSEEFSGSARMQAVLSYVVEESLCGRGDKIRAKTIGLDVYRYTADEIVDRESVVRVDAGRLRRKLEQYYERTGKDDGIVISLPIGSYKPVFNLPDLAGAGKTGVLSTRSFAIGAAIALTVAAIYIAVSSVRREPLSADAETPGDLTGHRAICDLSPFRVEAVNLGEDGRDLIFPALDPARLKVALEVFEVAIDKDATYFGGYAGAAQTLATIALLTLPPEDASDTLNKAGRHSQQALRHAPGAAWALSAQAWVDFANGELKSAVELSHRATEISPLDPHIAEFDSLISLFTSDFQKIFDEARRRHSESDPSRGFLFSNAMGSAKFHTGDYTGAIEVFEGAIADGAPFGPVSVSYLMAANYRLGHAAEARNLADLLERTWPGSRVDLLFAHLFTDPEPAAELAEAMRGAG